MVELGCNQLYLWPDWFTGTWNCIHLRVSGWGGERGKQRGTHVMCLQACLTPWLTDCFGHYCNTQRLP